MKSGILPIPLEADLEALVRQGATDTGLKLSDVMRQGLRHGVPAFVRRLKSASIQNTPACLQYLDDYPAATSPAKGYKQKLHAKLAKKYDRKNR
jgi:hypothetical protein